MRILQHIFESSLEDVKRYYELIEFLDSVDAFQKDNLSSINRENNPSVKIPGSVLKRLKHENVVPIYIAKDKTWYTGHMLEDIETYKSFDDLKKYSKKVVLVKEGDVFTLQTTTGLFRKRVAELNGSADASIFSQYLSILTIGLSSMSLQELMELTMFQLYDLVERYQLYINWDIDIKSRLAGAKPDERPENWMKNIH